MAWLVRIAVTSVVSSVVSWAVRPVLQFLGFGTGGIIAGSWAASFMATYGGLVTAGSVCAILQSIGATGTIVSGPLISFVVGLSTAAVVVITVAMLGSSETIRRGLSSGLCALRRILKAFGGIVGSALGRLAGASCSVLKTLGRIASSFFGRLGRASCSILNTLGTITGSALSRLGRASSSILNTLGMITGSAFNRLRGASMSALTKLRRVSSAAASRVVGFFRRLF